MKKITIITLFSFFTISSILSQPVPGDTDLGSLSDGVVGGGATMSDNFFSIIFILFLVSIYSMYKYKSLISSNIRNAYSRLKKEKGSYLKAPNISLSEKIIKYQIKNNGLAIK